MSKITVRRTGEFGIGMCVSEGQARIHAVTIAPEGATLDFVGTAPDPAPKFAAQGLVVHQYRWHLEEDLELA